MNEEALRKVLTVFLIPKFPGIEEVRVKVENGLIMLTTYKVYVGIRYSEMEKYKPQDIRETIRELSKYVLSPYEMLDIVFFDPHIYD